MIKLWLFYYVLSRAGRNDVKEEELKKYIYVNLDAKNSLIIILFSNEVGQDDCNGYLHRFNISIIIASNQSPRNNLHITYIMIFYLHNFTNLT